MPSIKRWLIGKDVAINITGMVPDINGLMVADPTGARPLIGKTDRLEARNSPNVQEISDMGAGYENDVFLKDRWEFRCTEIQRYTGSDLAYLLFNYQYYLLVATVGTKAINFYGVRGEGGLTFETGKSPADLTIRQVDIGSPNPTYV